jgi:energy-coupling factor transporter ATP-binding protein EcfA2/predicted  nucleic acid-binding Zn-ribbon protein
MKRLNRIILVNWYLIGAAEIRVDGHTAFIGPNASGKSSILDAIQTVLLGGHGHYLSLNPSAGDKSTRSVRDYCLGVVRDPDNPELSSEYQPRRQAVTYLALSFLDDRNGLETAVGLALHASLEQPREHVDGRFIAPGLSLLLSDLVETRGEGRVPRPWARVREDLRARCPGFETEAHPERFVEQLGAVLSYDGTQHLDPRRFLRNFKNAITFSPIRNVSDFVRRYVLEDLPIRVHELQRSLQSYRDISAKTREVKARVEDLKATDDLYRKAERAEQLAAQYAWAAREAELNALGAEMDPLDERLGEVRGRLDRLRAEIDRGEQQRAALTERLTELRARLQATDLAQHRRRIGAEREAAEAALGRVRAVLDGARRELAAVWRLLDHAGLLPPVLGPLLADLGRLLPRDEDLLAGVWPEDPAGLAAAVAAVDASLGECVATLEREQEARVLEEAELERELRELRARIGRLESGQADLSGSTVALAALLAARGIAATPLCDLTDVADEGWRDAIESYLGGQREALVVDPARARDAVTLYRREGRRQGLHGARVVNTARTSDWLERCLPGALAELVVTADPHARAYVNRVLGGVMRVESEAELLREERAVTADGMLVARGAVLRMPPVDPMLGREARERRLAHLQGRFAERAAAYTECQAGKRALHALISEELRPLGRAVSRAPDFGALTTERDAQGRRLADLRREEDGLDSAEYSGLEQAVAALEAEREGTEARLRTDNATWGGAQAEAGRLQAQIEELARRRAACEAARRAAAESPGLDRVEAAAQLERLEAEGLFHGPEAEAWRAIQARADQRAEQHRRDAARKREDARVRVTEYQARWGDPGALDLTGGDHQALSAWVLKTLVELEETTLARYTEQAANALREAEHAFRADFVGRLQENLGQLDLKLREINHNLRNRPFHGQYYSFERRPDPAFQDIIRWVEAWTPEEGGEVGGLFDPALRPDHPHREAIRQVQALLSAASQEGGGEVDRRLADYRNYYVFDVKMSDEGGRNPEYLSRRLGKGSGGEHQSPFYVAIGAALAATFRLQRGVDGQVRGGMALAVFDEAFSKLDVQNTVSALEFLNDLGLQVVLAAPDEKYGLVAEHVDTIVNVHRSGGAVHVDAEYLKPALRRMLSADNPVKRPPEPVDA